MERIIAEFEEIICNLSFTGINDAGTDIILKIQSALNLCRELDMRLGEKICDELIAGISEKNISSAVNSLCRLSFYTENLNNIL